MREIKFRAWTNPGEENEFRHGMLYDLAFDEFAPVNDSLDSVNEWGVLMQYTGLKDKSGVEIWEGDLIKNDKGRLCKVVWFKPQACFDAQFISDDGNYPNASDCKDHGFKPNLWDVYVEVIGNIYTSPELIEESK